MEKIKVGDVVRYKKDFCDMGGVVGEYYNGCYRMSYCVNVNDIKRNTLGQGYTFNAIEKIEAITSVNDFRVGDTILIKEKPKSWGSSLCYNNPLNLEYPLVGKIKEKKHIPLLNYPYMAGRIEIHGVDYGFNLDDMIDISYLLNREAVGKKTENDFHLNDFHLREIVNWRQEFGVEIIKNNEEKPQTTINKIMKNITTFVKELALSSDERLLRKYNLKTECGEYTHEAKDLVMNKMIEENEKFLVEVCEKMEAEENKNLKK